jgi:hypothetical protein
MDFSHVPPLIATVTLLVSIAVVVTAVSIGIAHAGAPLAVFRIGRPAPLRAGNSADIGPLSPHDLGPRPGAFSFRKFAAELPTEFTDS